MCSFTSGDLLTPPFFFSTLLTSQQKKHRAAVCGDLWSLSHQPGGFSPRVPLCLLANCVGRPSRWKVLDQQNQRLQRISCAPLVYCGKHQTSTIKMKSEEDEEQFFIIGKSHRLLGLQDLQFKHLDSARTGPNGPTCCFFHHLGQFGGSDWVSGFPRCSIILTLRTNHSDRTCKRV